MVHIKDRKQLKWYQVPETWVAEKFRHLFAHIAKLCYHYPYAMIIMSVAACLIVSPGVTMIKENDAVQDVWTPDGSRSQTDFYRYDDLYGLSVRFSNFKAYVDNENDNILTKSALITVLGRQLVAMSVKSIDGLALDDVCYRQYPAAPCMMTSLFSIWNNNITVLADRTQEEILEDITESEGFGTGKFTDLRTIIGGMRRVNGSVVSGKALSSSLFTLPGIEDSQQYVYSVNWEREWSNTDRIKFAVNAASSVSDELKASIRGDLVLTISAFGLIFLLTMIVFGKLSFLRSRLGLATACVSAVGLSVAFSYGLGGLLGIVQSGPSRLVPFLLAGVGVDTAYVIVNDFLEFSPLLPMSIRLQMAMANAGPSISMTSFASMAAFLASLETPFVALSTFAAYSFFGIFACYALESTFFVACLVLDQRRIAKHRMDCFCCIDAPSKERAVEPDEGKYVLYAEGIWTHNGHAAVAETPRGVRADTVSIPERVDVEMSNVASTSENKSKTPSSSPRHPLDITYINVLDYDECEKYHVEWQDVDGGPSVITRFMANYYNKLLKQMWFRVSVLVVAVVVLSVAIYGITQMEQKFTLAELAGPGSYVVEWFDIGDKYYSELPYEVKFVMDHTVDNADPKQLAKLDAVTRAAESEGDWIDARNTNSWLDNYKTYVNGSDVPKDYGVPNNRTEFYSSLGNFIANPMAGARYTSDFVFRSDGTLRGNRIEVTTWTLNNTVQSSELMKVLRDIADEKGGDSIFPWDFQFIWFEQWAVLLEEAILNIGSSFIFVFIVMILFVDYKVAGTVGLIVVIISIGQVGLAHFWGLGMNVLTVANIVMSVGLSIDYSAHLVHCMYHMPGSGIERQQKAMTSVGSSVTNGALSTLFAVLPLGWAKSGIFLSFFKMFFLNISLGMFYGLLVLPTFLPFIFGDKPKVVPTPPAETANRTKSTEPLTLHPASPDNEVIPVV